jgi:hypothetical protein
MSMRGWIIRLVLAGAMLACALPQVSMAAYYDRQDRAWRVQRGERLEWNILDDFRAFPADQPDYRASAVYSWAACMQMAFALGNYWPSQTEVINNTFRSQADMARFEVNRTPREVHINANGQDVYLSLNTLPGRLGADDTITAIDHGAPVILVLNPAHGRQRGGDPLLERRQNAVRLVLLHGYHWDTDPRTSVRTLWVDVYDPQPPDGAPADSVGVPYNELAKAWAYTLRGNLVSLNSRLGISGPG